MKPAAHPVLTCAEAKAWEMHLLTDESAEWKAMQRAGAAVALAVEDDFKEIGRLPESGRLLVLVGKGHNGGDVLLAAQAILKGHPQATADVLLAFGEAALRPLAHRSLSELRASGGLRIREVSLDQLKSEMGSYAVCLDGVFGFQFRPPLDDATGELIAWVNTHPRLALRAAVDLPSGLGETPDKTIFRADFTYATGIVKAPVLLPEYARWVGRLRYLDLGFFDESKPLAESADQVISPTVLALLAKFRSPQSDKRTYGHLLVVGGSLNYPGAVMLAVRAALRSGVGLVTGFVPESLVPEYAARQPEAMWVGCPVTTGGGLAAGTLDLVGGRGGRGGALLIGPGMGTEPETLAMVAQMVRESSLPLVLDADTLRSEIIEATGEKPFIVTPHAGEFQRIASVLTAKPQAVVVEKGPLTQIVHEGTSYWSFHGGPVLARGGSGDMLAGLIGGLLAQQPNEPLLAACQGTVWHGLAADLLARTHGQVAVENAQLLEQLGPALTSTTCQTY